MLLLFKKTLPLSRDLGALTFLKITFFLSLVCNLSSVTFVHSSFERDIVMLPFVRQVVDTSASGNVFFILFEPDLLDFTNDKITLSMEIHCSSSSEKFSVELKHLPLLIEILRETVFIKENKVFVWNWKDFISFVNFHLNKLIEFKGFVFDLAIAESYFFEKLDKPSSFNEVMSRFKKIKNDSDWEKFYNIYKEIYYPLLSVVVPCIETSPLLDYDAKKRVYSFYQINGQDNGRMLCSNVRVHGFNPHTLSKEQKDNFKPCVPFNLFLGFDFKSMEVAVLAHLANDEALLELMDAKDIYSSIFQKITNSSITDANSRNVAKKIFLPTIYGMSAKTIAEQAKIDYPFAEQICKNINTIFFKSTKYVKEFVTLAESHGIVSDYFGKRRKFTENFYKARNFCIQSPASLICLEKLVELWKITHDKTRICYHVHDGYYVYATNENWKEIVMDAKRVLVSESKICPGLRLRVTCQVGAKLNTMKSLEKR